MRADVQYSILQNKFREWFEDPDTGDIPFLEKADSPFENSVQADPPFTAEANHLNHRSHRTYKTRKRSAVNAAKLFQLLFFGSIGAISFGSGVGITFSNLNLNFEGWYSHGWPSQSAVIFVAAVLGFNFGLFLEYVFLQRER